MSLNVHWNQGFAGYQLKSLNPQPDNSLNNPLNNQNNPLGQQPPINNNQSKGWWEKIQNGAIKIFLIPIAQGIAESGKVYLAVGVVALGMILLFGASLVAIGACSAAFAFGGLPLIGLGMLTIPIAILCIMSTATETANLDQDSN